MIFAGLLKSRLYVNVQHSMYLCVSRGRRRGVTSDWALAPEAMEIERSLVMHGGLRNLRRWIVSRDNEIEVCIRSCLGFG